MRKFALLLCLFASLRAFAADDDSTRHAKLDKLWKVLQHVKVGGYGAINYYVFNWETDTARRDAIDLERFVFELKIKFTDKLKLNSEIEFEHGGTGAAVEFDRFEEFGEFEYEIEKGGEILIEQLNLEYNHRHWLNIRAGRVKVPVGLYYAYDEPTEYFTPTIAEMEANLIPTAWTDFGVMFSGSFDKENRFQYVLGAVNGLDNSAFSSATWIRRGNQKRFETVNAEDWAGTARFDYSWKEENAVGVSGYFGNSTNNRPKPDLKVPGYVGIVDAHAAVDYGFIKGKAAVLWGNVSNADAISAANRNLSNNLNVKRTPVGSQALGAYAELGTDILEITRSFSDMKFKGGLTVYGRFDYYDSMFRTTGDVFNNPRWERKAWGVGLNFQPVKQVVLKSYFSSRKVGIPDNNMENTFIMGLGFAF